MQQLLKFCSALKYSGHYTTVAIEGKAGSAVFSRLLSSSFLDLFAFTSWSKCAHIPLWIRITGDSLFLYKVSSHGVRGRNGKGDRALVSWVRAGFCCSSDGHRELQQSPSLFFSFFVS